MYISANRLVFCSVEPNQDSQSVSLRLGLTEMCELKKANSMFVYTCLVVCCKDAQYWFSSLPNRDTAYNLLEHLWRNQLIPSKSRPGQSAKPTTLGQDLLKIASDSEETLKEAANTLRHQGAQLSNALDTMCDLHDDLTVAESVLTRLESWLGRWSLPPEQSEDIPIEIVDASAIPRIFEYPVVYRKVSRLLRIIF